MNNELLIKNLKSNNSEVKSNNEEKQIIEEMAKVLKDYTERNHIMASHVILECYAEELYSKNYRKQSELTMSQVKQSEWISVEERLPESGVSCLLCCDVKRYDGTHKQYICDGFHAERFKEECHFADDECVVEYNEETDEYYLHEGWYENINNWDEYSSIAIDDIVTHWMPLPEAPKMKGDSDDT